MLEKRAIQKAETVSEQHFSCEKEGWGKPSSDKSEKTQCIHPLRALQNGRFALPAISSGTKRFSAQDRSQRRLLCNSSQQTAIKICEIQDARDTLIFLLQNLGFVINLKKSNALNRGWRIGLHVGMSESSLENAALDRRRFMK